MPPSKESFAIAEIFTFLGKYLAGENVDTGLYRLLLEELHSATPEPTDVTYEEVICPGTVKPSIWCKPLTSSSSHVILFFHGGAFAAGSPSSHRKLAGHLAKATGSYALLLDYRRAPEHQFPSQIQDAVAAYQWLREEKGFTSEHIVTVGDSAGANMSITLSLELKNLGVPRPAAVACLSPWLDMKMTGKSYITNAKKDVLVTREAIENVRAGYLGNTPLDTPLVDLLNADFTGFPPMFLAVGGSEITVDDSTQLVERARAAAVETHLEISEDMQHLYFLMVGNAPEANKTISDLAGFLRRKLKIEK